MSPGHLRRGVPRVHDWHDNGAGGVQSLLHSTFTVPTTGTGAGLAIRSGLSRWDQLGEDRAMVAAGYPVHADAAYTDAPVDEYVVDGDRWDLRAVVWAPGADESFADSGGGVAVSPADQLA